MVWALFIEISNSDENPPQKSPTTFINFLFCQIYGQSLSLSPQQQQKFS